MQKTIYFFGFLAIVGIGVLVYYVILNRKRELHNKQLLNESIERENFKSKN